MLAFSCACPYDKTCTRGALHLHAHTTLLCALSSLTSFGGSPILTLVNPFFHHNVEDRAPDVLWAWKCAHSLKSATSLRCRWCWQRKVTFYDRSVGISTDALRWRAAGKVDTQMWHTVCTTVTGSSRTVNPHTSPQALSQQVPNRLLFINWKLIHIS